VDNGNRALQVPINQGIVTYTDFTRESGRTIILPVGADYYGNSTYAFETTIILGGAHLAFNPQPANSPFAITLLRVYGDRLGTLHVGSYQNVTMSPDLASVQVSYSIYVYPTGVVLFPPVIDVYRAQIWMSGRISQVQNLTFHHGGTFYCLPGGGTLYPNVNDTYQFDVLRVQDGSNFSMELINPVIHPGMVLITNATYIEGGAQIKSSRLPKCYH